MQLHLEGSEDLNLPRERVYQLLTDSSFISKSLPDAEETKVIDDSNLEAKMKIGISFLTTRMAVKMKIADRVPSQHARLYVEGAGTGSNMKITSDFDLEGETATKMKWVADAEITGVMAGIGSSILKGFAEKKVKEIFEGIKKAMVQASPDAGQK
jgi:carbon monoxide dehydrogenase subunit G